jgi:pre-rRNA-processing protein RIX1
MVTEKEDEHFMGHELDTILESAGRVRAAVNDLVMTDASGTDVRAFFDSGPTQTRESGKRAHIGQTPLSPSKRIKTGEEEHFAAPAPPAVEVADPISTLPQTSDFAATSTASVMPGLPVPGDVSDSDEDDIVSLTLGQDTDDDDE